MMISFKTRNDLIDFPYGVILFRMALYCINFLKQCNDCTSSASFSTLQDWDFMLLFFFLTQLEYIVDKIPLTRVYA